MTDHSSSAMNDENNKLKIQKGNESMQKKGIMKTYNDSLEQT